MSNRRRPTAPTVSLAEERLLARVHAEEHPVELWGNGLGRDGSPECGHPDCESASGVR